MVGVPWGLTQSPVEGHSVFELADVAPEAAEVGDQPLVAFCVEGLLLQRVVVPPRRKQTCVS